MTRKEIVHIQDQYVRSQSTIAFDITTDKASHAATAPERDYDSSITTWKKSAHIQAGAVPSVTIYNRIRYHYWNIFLCKQDRQKVGQTRTRDRQKKQCS